jgi:hypothetical protein
MARVFLFFRLQRPPLTGWSDVIAQVALTYVATIIVALAAWNAQRPDLIRSPKRFLAHLWESGELRNALGSNCFAREPPLFREGASKVREGISEKCIPKVCLSFFLRPCFKWQNSCTCMGTSQEECALL